MDRIGVRQLQQNASRALRRVRLGERIEITDRGRPVAILAPVDPQDVRGALEAAGRLIRAEENLLEIPAPIRVSTSAATPSRRLHRMRAIER